MALTDSGRLEAFSDGILAVAITLLAFNLAIKGPTAPHPLSTQLFNEWPAVAAYLVSFLTIGTIWVNHHALFKNLRTVDRTLLFLNLLLMMFVVLIPFATSVMADYLRTDGAAAHLAAAVYGGVLEAMSLSFAAILRWSIRKGHLHRPLTAAEGKVALRRFAIGVLAYVVAAATAFISAPLALALYGVIGMYYVFEHTPTQPADPIADFEGEGGT